MWFSSWLRKRTVSPKRHPANRFRPCLEVLEDRAVPATLTVNTPLDVLGHTNGLLSLRQAILDNNAATTATTIVVPADTYTLTLVGTDFDSVPGVTGDLDISPSHNHALTLSGAGAGTTTIDGAGLVRVFDVFTSNPVSISGLTIKGGNAGSSNGGGIANTYATVTVSDCIFSGNSAAAGGAIYNPYPAGALIVNNCAFSGNVASSTSTNGGNGGAIIGTGITINNCTFTANSAQRSGGGIYNVGTMTISNCTFTDNTARNGGGIDNQGQRATMTVSNSTFSGNSASSSGGGVLNWGGKLTLRGCTVKGNTAPSGADLYGTASLSDTTIGDTYYP